MSERTFRYRDPREIEQRSMEIISGILAEKGVLLPDECAPVIRRVIHTTADFDYAENLVFSDQAVKRMTDAITSGTDIVTDTEMAKAGINKKRLLEYGGTVHCFMSDPDVAEEAKERGLTRAAVSMERAAKLGKPCIFAIGNAPTALMRLDELVRLEQVLPAGIIGVPVGFVNVTEAKERILSLPVPYIVARGRKGGSNVAAAVINAILYQI